jgi:rhodanese-related sulfurtransferase
MSRVVGRALALILAAAACAAISNATASRERKLAWVGAYPRALDVAPVSGEPASGAAAAPAAPAPGTPAVSNAPSPAASASASASASAPGAAAAAAKAFPPHPDRAFVEIGTDDAQILFKQGRLFIDARRSSVYADGHVPGARNFPVWESDIADRVKAFYEEGLDQNAPIVIYCSGGDCEDSHMLAEKLYMVGFNDLLVDKDGFPAWQKRGLPVTKGAKP